MSMSKYVMLDANPPMKLEVIMVMLIIRRLY